VQGGGSFEVKVTVRSIMVRTDRHTNIPTWTYQGYNNIKINLKHQDLFWLLQRRHEYLTVRGVG